MKTKVINRREFLKMSSVAAAGLGLSSFLLPTNLFANGKAAKKPAVIWLEAQDCTGCTESVLSSLNPMPIDILLDTINLQYHETLMSGSGSVAESVLDAAISEGGYVLVLEGSIPAADKRYLQVGGVAVEDRFVEAAQNAAAVLAIGACACWGGIPRASVSNGRGAEYFLNKHNVNKNVINLPGCPVHPHWFYTTVVNVLSGNNISLDNDNRPTEFFNRKVHDLCEYNKKDGNNDLDNKDLGNGCLEKYGCKGKSTYANCPSIKWNDGVNWCVQSGAPCSGCTEPDFYNKYTPLFIEN